MNPPLAIWMKSKTYVTFIRDNIKRLKNRSIKRNVLRHTPVDNPRFGPMVLGTLLTVKKESTNE